MSEDSAEIIVEEPAVEEPAPPTKRQRAQWKKAYDKLADSIFFESLLEELEGSGAPPEPASIHTPEPFDFLQDLANGDESALSKIDRLYAEDTRRSSHLDFGSLPLADKLPSFGELLRRGARVAPVDRYSTKRVLQILPLEKREFLLAWPPNPNISCVTYCEYFQKSGSLLPVGVAGAVKFIMHYARPILEARALQAAADGLSGLAFRKVMSRATDDLGASIHSRVDGETNICLNVGDELEQEAAHWCMEAMSGSLRPLASRAGYKASRKRRIVKRDPQQLALRNLRIERFIAYVAECKMQGVIRTISRRSILRWAKKLSGADWEDGTVESYSKWFFGGKEVPTGVEPAINLVYSEKPHLFSKCRPLG